MNGNNDGACGNNQGLFSCLSCGTSLPVFRKYPQLWFATGASAGIIPKLHMACALKNKTTGGAG
jgi:hypothetical protein